jgi:hypothetical protein
LIVTDSPWLMQALAWLEEVNVLYRNTYFAAPKPNFGM